MIRQRANRHGHDWIGVGVGGQPGYAVEHDSAD